MRYVTEYVPGSNLNVNTKKVFVKNLLQDERAFVKKQSYLTRSLLLVTISTPFFEERLENE